MIKKNKSKYFHLRVSNHVKYHITPLQVINIIRVNSKTLFVLKSISLCRGSIQIILCGVGGYLENLASNKETQMAGLVTSPVDTVNSSKRMKNKDPTCLTVNNSPYAAETYIYTIEHFPHRFFLLSLFCLKHASFLYPYSVRPPFLVFHFPLHTPLPIHKCCSLYPSSCFVSPISLRLVLGEVYRAKLQRSHIWKKIKTTFY